MQLTVVRSFTQRRRRGRRGFTKQLIRPGRARRSRTMALGSFDVSKVEIEITEDEILADLLYPGPANGAGSHADRSRASRTSNRTPKPVAPLPTYSRPTSQAVPAMSRWAQGLSSTNSSRNEAA